MVGPWDASGRTGLSSRPILSLSLAVNYQISGLKVWSYHAFNLTVHILAGLVVLGIVRRTLLSERLRERFGQASLSLVLVCALIWLVHPLQTQSVTYIIQRGEALMGLCYLLTLYCVKAYNNRGFAYRSKGEYDQAIRDFDKAIELNPGYVLAYGNRWLACRSKGAYKQATRDFYTVLKLNPSPTILNDLSWALATHQDAQFRDGTEAVHLAERACQLTDYKMPTFVDTLAAAYAEVGQFDKAVKTDQKAIQLALAAGKEKLAKDMQNRLELYKAKRPYRE